MFVYVHNKCAFSRFLQLAEGFVGISQPAFDEIAAHLVEVQAAQVQLIEMLAQV